MAPDERHHRSTDDVAAESKATTDAPPRSQPSASSNRRARADDRSVTLQTIAERVGVSRSTVSNAYSRPDQLAPALRARILRVAAELGYPGPHPIARRLRHGRAGAIGLLLTEALTYAFRDPAAVLFLEGVAEVLQQTDIGLLLLPAQPGHAFDPAGIRGAAVDGFLVYSVSDGHPALEAVLRRGLPTVVVDQPRIASAKLVVIDDEGAAYSAARHLVEMGHRSFAILTDPLSTDRSRSGVRLLTHRRETKFEVTRLRLKGYRRALEEAAIEWTAVPILECFANTPEAGQEALVVASGLTPRPTALLCLTDQIALGVLRGADRLGLVVPTDLSVVGFDDVPAAATARPPLTTVRQPLLAKGRVAAELLVSQSESPVRLVQLETELVVRSSTSRPPETESAEHLANPSASAASSGADHRSHPMSQH